MEQDFPFPAPAAGMPISNDVPGVKLTKFSLFSMKLDPSSAGASSVASMVRRVASANDRSLAPAIWSFGRLARAMPALLADVDDVDPVHVFPEDVEDLIGWDLYVALVNGALSIPASNKLPNSKPHDCQMRIVKEVENRTRLLPPGVPEFNHFDVAQYLNQLSPDEISTLLIGVQF